MAPNKHIIISTGFFSFLCGIYSVHHYKNRRVLSGMSDKSAEPPKVFSEEKRLRIFTHEIDKKDKTLQTQELVKGILKLRFKLAGMASGDVLEVGTGTGRNMKYYRLQKCKSFTFLEPSESLLNAARVKWNTTCMDYMKKREPEDLYPKARFVEAKISSLEHYKENSFDSVIESFGLCSYEDPVVALKEMKRVCKPGGNILLLEHGLSNYQILNRYMEAKSADHLRTWGCVWNKDIEAIVKEGCGGLELKESFRQNFGTTYGYVFVKPAGAGK